MAETGAHSEEPGFPSPVTRAPVATAGATDRHCQHVLPVRPRPPAPRGAEQRGRELDPGDGMGEGDPGVEHEPRKETRSRAPKNKPEPAPTAGHILGLRTCVPSRRGTTGPSPGGSPVTFPFPPSTPKPRVYRFGFLLGSEFVGESLGFLPARGRGGLCPRPGLAGLPGLPGFHALVVNPQRGRRRRHGARGAGLRVPGVKRGRAAAGSVDECARGRAGLGAAVRVIRGQLSSPFPAASRPN